MRICVISAFPPSFDNMNGPTSLPFNIIKNSPKGAQIYLYYYPGDNKYKEIVDDNLKTLNLKKRLEISFPGKFYQWYNLVKAKKRGFPSGVGCYPVISSIVHEINDLKPDVVWIYPHWLIDWVCSLSCENIIITGPDSSCLHSERVIRYGKWDSYESVLAEILQYKRNMELEKALSLTKATLHFVGLEDLRKYLSLGNKLSQGFYSPYFFSHYEPIKNSIVKTENKLKIVITGGGTTVYVGDHLTRFFSELVNSSKNLSNFYDFTFIGDGYENFISLLNNLGYSTTLRKWVNNYAEEISSAQIQIFPIAVGTGTKTKVLNALSTGLLAIGSTFSYENIEILPGEDCILYQQPEDIVDYLNDIILNKEKYEAMAQKGMMKVRVNHNPEKCCKNFWDKVLCKDLE